MQGSKSSKFLTRKYSFYLWVAVLVTSATFVVANLSREQALTSNILHLLPKQDAAEQIVLSTLQANTERQFVILVQDSSAGAKSLINYLTELPGIDLSTDKQDTANLINQTYKSFRNQLIDSQTIKQLERNTPRAIADSAISQLYNPAPSYRLYTFAADPFNLGGKWIQQASMPKIKIGPDAIAYIEDDSQRWYIVSGQLKGSPYSLATHNQLERTFNQLYKLYPNISLLFSGTVFHAAEGARIARKEISTIGLGSLAGLILLVLVTFRSFKDLFFLALVLTSSSIVALSATFLLFKQVHLITLAFGATLLGLASDYCFHFLVKAKVAGGHNAKTLLSKGLVISATSSSAAYLVQLFTPFPGLQQCAIFVASGLLAAVISTLVFGPYLVSKGNREIYLCQIYNRYIVDILSRLSKDPILVIALVFFLGSVIALPLLETNDDIRILNTSGAKLISHEKKVGQLLSNIDSQRFFLVKGDSQQKALENTESLAAKVEEITQEKASKLLVIPNKLIPSIKKQSQNYQLTQERLYSENGALNLLCQHLSGDCSWHEPIPEFSPLLTKHIPAKIKEMHPGLALIDENEVVVFLNREANDFHVLFKELDVPGTDYVDQIFNISNTLKNIRHRVIILFLIFGLCFILFAIKIFGKPAFGVIGPALISSSVALCIASYGGLTLFHILALLLVVGITVDSGVLYITPGLNSSTWAASTIASLSSIIAFGLLALSKVPVLHQFGTVVLAGLLTSWLITPVFRAYFEQQDKINQH